MAIATPDILVLAGGGILGEAWMSALLAGLAEGEAFDPCACEHYIGTSAGSIVAAALAGGVDPRTRLGRLPEPPQDSEDDEATSLSGGERVLAALAGAGGAAAGPFVSIALRTSAPGGRLARRALLARVPVGRRSLGGLGSQVGGLHADWDGRLAISAVEIESGRRVMFGTEGAPEASVGQAVEASCSIPGVFRPVEIEGRRYVDGGAWSPTNMDTAEVSRGSRVLCLNPTGSLRPGARSVIGALGLVSRSMAAAEAATLRHRGARVAVLAPDRDSRLAMGPSLMDSRPRQGVIAAGLEQGRRLRRTEG